MRGIPSVALLGLVLAIGGGASASDRPFHLRGTLVAVEGDRLTVETEDEDVFEVVLKADAELYEVTPARPEDIEEGRYVGVTSIEADGRRVALEVHIFAEDLHGTAEGHHAWDLVAEPNTMTNATVAKVQDVGGEREIVVRYAAGEGEARSEGSQTILVPASAAVVHLARAGDRTLLAPDKTVFLIVENTPDGAPTAVAAVVGQEIAPPM